MRRFFILLGIFAVVLSMATIVPAAAPQAGTITPSARKISWSGGPLIGGQGEESCVMPPTDCDRFALRIGIPSSYWRSHPGGVSVRIDWSDPGSELDLTIHNPKGDTIADSNFAGRAFQQVFISDPAPGSYPIEVAGYFARGMTYTGTAVVVEQRTKRAASSPNTMRFANTLVDPQLYGLEPGIWADKGGRVFVSAIQGATTLGSFLWRSDDGGRTFAPLDARLPGNVADPRRRPCVETAGGVDADVVTDRTGRVYFADLEIANITTGYSTDHGNTWHCDPLSVPTTEVDRPWLAPAPTADVDGDGIDAYLCFNDLGDVPGADQAKPRRIHILVTTDGGATWKEGATFGAGLAPTPGRIFTARDGALYVVYESENGVWTARSEDGGKTFRQRLVSQRIGRPGGHAFVTGAVDEAGNLYAAWVEQGTYDVLYSASRDKGSHWSLPVRVNPPQAETTYLPWIAAGKPGDVAIAWYGTAAAYPLPGLAAPKATWYPWVARTSSATSAVPGFQITRLSETPVHIGSCCAGFADFMRIAIAPDGATLASYEDDAYVGTSVGKAFVEVARQVSGLGMSTADARSAARLGEARGDATFPASPSTDGDVPELDLTSLPSAFLSGNVMRVSFSLSSVARLNEVAGSLAPGSATDAYWIAIWKANGRMEYAGMHVNASGGREFFGGDHPVGVSDATTSVDQGLGEIEAASYPKSLPLKGTVDAATGRVTIDVPLGTFHLKAGDDLRRLQVFSMAGLSNTRTAYTMPQVVDSTGGVSVRLLTSASPNTSTRVRAAEQERTLPATGVGSAPLTRWVLGAACLLAAWLRAPRRSKGATRPGC